MTSPYLDRPLRTEEEVRASRRPNLLDAFKPLFDAANGGRCYIHNEMPDRFGHCLSCIKEVTTRTQAYAKATDAGLSAESISKIEECGANARYRGDE
jgi:hypothetical protein